VDCAVGEGAIKVVFQQYCSGFATVLIVNHTISSHIDYFQKFVVLESCVQISFFIVKVINTSHERQMRTFNYNSVLPFIYVYCDFVVVLV